MKHFHYKPHDGWLADVVPFYWDGMFRLFYLHDYRDIAGHGEGCPWRQIVSKDLVHFEEKGDMILRGTMDEQDLFIYTGCVIHAEGKFHIFYTGHNHHLIPKGRAQEAVMHAVSDDLEHWEKCEGEYFFAPEGYEMHDWRDPFIFFDEQDGQYHMILAARKKKGPAQKRGCTVHATSPDLKEWQVQEPLWDPELYFTHECPDLFKLGEWYYLIYSEFSDEFRTRYVRSRSLYGPWEAPKDDVFDSRAFYAAKTAYDGETRYLFGWNPTRESNRDDGPFQWGGDMIVHELWQDEAGELRVKMPASYKEAFSKPVEIELVPTVHAECVDGEWTLSNDAGYAECRTDRDLPPVCLIEADIEVKDAVQQLGVRFRLDPPKDLSYAMNCHLNKAMWSCITMPRSAWGKLDEFSLQRQMSQSANGVMHVVLLVDHDVVTLYVDDSIALNMRTCNGHSNHLAFYVCHGTAKVRNIRITQVEE